MNYKAGDTVICIDAKTILYPTNLVAGQKYVVHFTDGRDCTSVEGVRPVDRPASGWCHACGEHTHGLGHFFPSRFIKLDDLHEEQEQHQLDEALA